MCCNTGCCCYIVDLKDKASSWQHEITVGQGKENEANATQQVIGRWSGIRQRESGLVRVHLESQQLDKSCTVVSCGDV